MFLQVALAADAELRSVQFAWEAIEDAKRYDLEFDRGEGQTALKFKTEKPEWQGQVPVGKYLVRIRSRDSRNVPGDWSAPFELSVAMPSIQLISPKHKTKLQAPSTEEVEVEFAWKATGTATGYRIEVFADGDSVVSEEVSESRFKTNLPPGKLYSWQVSPVVDDLDIEKPKVWKFNIKGRILPPEIDKVSGVEPVEEIGWSEPDMAESYDAVLLKKKGKRWKVVKKSGKMSDNELTFDQALPAGDYEFRVRARSKSSGRSEFARHAFTVFPDREPAAVEELTTTKKKPRKDFFYVLKYRATQPSFVSENKDIEYGSFNFQESPPVAGSGVFGFGYDSDYNNWGGLLTLELSGFASKNASTEEFDLFNYTAADITGFYKKQWAVSTLQMIGGIYYRELPMLNGARDDSGEQPVIYATGSSRISYAGLATGLDYMSHVTSSIGYRTRAMGYIPMMTVFTPNSNSVNMDLSYELSLHGFWHFTGRTTGFIGVVNRADIISFESADGTDTSEVILQGTYIDLVIETDY